MHSTANEGAKLPKVSVGLPVFNGEAYLAEALDSLLGQSFTDFEVIISDNGSTDRTEEICRQYAARDPRITYLRHPKNRGVSWNYDTAFEHARGEYFQWLAYDDMLAPDFLEKCVDALDRNPDAVLCQSLIDVIDEKGKTIGMYDSGVVGTRPSAIFAKAVLKAHWCTELLGLIKSSALRNRSPYGQYHGSDEVLLAELSMQGAFIRIPEPLFKNREHKGRYSASVASASGYAAWYGTDKKHAKFPKWRMYRQYFTVVRKHQKDPKERIKCYGALVRWWFVDWNAIRMIVDLLTAIDPRIFVVVSRLKRRLLGSAAPMLQRGD